MDRWAYKITLLVTIFVSVLAFLFLSMIPLSLIWSSTAFALGWYFGPLFLLQLPLLFWLLANSRSRQIDFVRFLGR